MKGAVFMKKTLSILLSFIMLLSVGSVAGVSAFAEQKSFEFDENPTVFYEYDKTTNTLIVLGKNPANITTFTFWDFRKFSYFGGDLNNFIKKYDLEKMTPGSPYLKHRNMQWGCTKKI